MKSSVLHLLLLLLPAVGRAVMPVISDPAGPVAVTNVLGDPFTFGITVDNDDGSFRYRWQKGGALISTNSNPSAATPNYEVPASSGGDAGTYTCRVYPSVGSSVESPPFYLTIFYPPVIVNQPKSMTVSQGGTATFTVKASTSYAPTNFTYQWLQDGFEVDGATNATLTLTNVQPEDEGDYTVEIANGATAISDSGLPTVSTNAYLTVVVPPTISFQPDDQFVEVGDFVDFSVVLDPSTTDTEANPVTYRWRRYGVNILTSINSTAIEDTLELDDAQLSDQGLYTVEVRNSAGSVISEPAALWFVPQLTDASETDVTVVAGTNLQFTSAAVGTTPLSYQWLFNGAPIAGAATANWTLHVGSVAQAGDYWVLVTNIAGENQSFPLRLTVLPETNPPTVAITSPGNGVRWSNAVVTVTGTASDNGQVDAVRYTLNGATNIFTASGTNVWQFSFNPVPGTNTYSVYAVDACTNQSAVATRSIFYVVTAPFALTQTGLGSITTNWTGAALEIGRNYTMTAVPASGYTFAGWSGGVQASTATLTFMMQSNLAIQANFVDTNRPTFAITNPPANTRFTNTIVTVRGSITDNGPVAGYYWRLGSNVWTAVAATNPVPGTISWNVSVNPAAGTNVFSAYAADAAGNYSLTNTLSLVYTGVFAPVITDLVRSSGIVTVNFPSVAGVTYALEYKDLLGAPTWSTLAGSLIGTGGPLFLNDTNPPSGERFYRLKGQP